MAKGLATESKQRPRKAKELGPHAERREEAEKRILEAAVDIIVEHGVTGVTLADVGTASGYSRGLPAHYFGNKTGLLRAVADHITDNIANKLAMTLDLQPGLPALLRTIENYLTISPKNRKQAVAIQALLAESLTEDVLTEAVMKITERSVKRLAALIKAAVANREIRADVDAQREAVLILGAMRSLVAIWLISPDAARLDAMRRTFVDGVKRSLSS